VPPETTPITSCPDPKTIFGDTPPGLGAPSWAAGEFPPLALRSNGKPVRLADAHTETVGRSHLESAAQMRSRQSLLASSTAARSLTKSPLPTFRAQKRRYPSRLGVAVGSQLRVENGCIVFLRRRRLEMTLRECPPLALPLRTGHGGLPGDVVARALAVRTGQRLDGFRATKGLLARLANPSVLCVVCHRCCKK
jgi:hypothetical protein